MIGVLKLLPSDREEPPVAAAYQLIAPVVPGLSAPTLIARRHVTHLALVENKIISLHFVAERPGPQMHADLVADHQIVLDDVVLGVVDKKSLSISRHHIVLDGRILEGAQHDTVIGIAPGDVVAHCLVARLHERQTAAIQVGLVALPEIVIGIHVVRAIA